MKRIIRTDNAPQAVGAYSQGTSNQDVIFTAGQIALTPDGEFLKDASVSVQTEQCLENITAILEAEGAKVDDVLKVTVFLADIEDFEAMNETYANYFDENQPARSAFEVGNLPKGAKVEIEAVATAE